MRAWGMVTGILSLTASNLAAQAPPSSYRIPSLEAQLAETGQEPDESTGAPRPRAPDGPVTTALPPDATPVPRPGQVVARPEQEPVFYSDPGRLIVVPTGWTLKKGERTFNNYDLAGFDFQFGLGENWQLGLQTAVPFSFAGLAVSIRAGLRFPHGSVALQSQVFGGYLFIDQADAAFMAGGGPILTIGSEDHHLSMSTMVFAVLTLAASQNQTFALVVPTIGASVRIAKRARLLAELWIPGRTDDAGRQLGELFIVLYGARVFGERYWGDLGFFRHVCSPRCNGFYEKIPMGLPYINFGRRF